ncbi:MAG: hypothetical protein DRR06_20155 [Gammaproteobacteria bacterium]|nr:MAG: hypothetical protein DRR06_20155 [Gammaproteobacteria bacterium]RLA49799.1 MAG: hypothetical protein DRR42_14850 [Gammaproteobacteria bacterium]
MANFTEAYKQTSAHEGGYVNDTIDRGGETYRGISRIHHPSWSGWEVIGAQKGKSNFPLLLKSDRSLQATVKKFYKQKYWDKFQGDEIADQEIANELYDTGVNMGVRQGVRFLQNGLNLLNRDENNYQDIVIDGWFGGQTLATLATHAGQDRSIDALLRLMNIQQGARYVTIMEADSSQERYARGWLKRT